MILVISGMFIASNSRLYPQKKFSPGYIINNLNDTIDGQVDISNIRRGTSIIYFKTGDSPEISEYNPMDIKGFFAGNELYVSKILQVDKSPSRNDELLRGEAGEAGRQMWAYREASDLSVQKIIPLLDDGDNIVSDSGLSAYSAYQIPDTDTLFVNVCVTGYANLYYHMDENSKEHFFIGTEFYDRELVKLRYLNLGDQVGDNESFVSIVELQFYIVQLMEYFDICPELHNDIMKLNYSLKDLIKVFSDYNICAGAEDIYIKPPVERKAQIQLVGGFSLNTTSFSGNAHKILDGGEFGYETGFSLGIASEFFIDDSRRGPGFYSELVYRKYSLSGVADLYTSDDIYDYAELDFSINEIDFLNMVRYTFTNTIISPFIDAGISIDYKFRVTSSVSGESYYYGVTHPISGDAINDIKPFGLKYSAGLGATISDRVSFHLLYQAGGGLSPYFNLNSTSANIALRIGYVF